MGGVGKTALAVVLAHRFKARYPDAQLYLNLRGAGADPAGQFSASGIKPLSPAEAMQNLIHAFQPEARLPETLAELTPRFHAVLNGAGRVLLLLDNAAGAEQVKPLRPPPSCLLLVTSRAQFQLPGLATRNLDCLPPDKARALLCRLAARFKPAPVELKDAAELCGHLPLALEVFAGAVNDHSLTLLPELLARLRTRQDRLSPVDAAFEVSYELLSEALRRCWRLLAAFPASFSTSARRRHCGRPWTRREAKNPGSAGTPCRPGGGRSFGTRRQGAGAPRRSSREGGREPPRLRPRRDASAGQRQLGGVEQGE
jgi:hypothetical protein